MARGSRAKAINNFCKACIYDPHHGNGTWRQQVEACTSVNCPLYPFRPLSSGGKDETLTVPLPDDSDSHTAD